MLRSELDHDQNGTILPVLVTKLLRTRSLLVHFYTTFKCYDFVTFTYMPTNVLVPK